MIHAAIVCAHQLAPRPKKTARKPSADPAADRPPKFTRSSMPSAILSGDAQPLPNHDLTCTEPLIEAVDPGALIADKAFEADAFIAALKDRAIAPVIPSKSNRKPRDRATSPSTANAISLSVSSISSSISALSPRATTSSQKSSSPAFTSPAPPSSSTEDSPKLFGAETFEEGIGGRLGRSDPRTPGVKFEPGLAGTAGRRGEDASGSVAIYWLSGEP